MATDNYELNYTHEGAKEVVIKNANLFYNGHQTELNDLVYDALLEMIKKDEPTFNIYEHITYDTDSVRAPHSITFRDYTKDSDIASIDSEEKFNEWKKDYVILPKFDGSSTVTYLDDNWNERLILSRGDDDTGFVNTKKLRYKYIEAMAHRANFDLHDSKIVAVLSEAVVPSELGGRAQANGLVNSKYCQDDVDAKLFMMPFDAVLKNGMRVPNLKFEITDYNKFCYLRDNGEIKTELGTIPCDGIVMYSRDTNDLKLVIKKLYYSEKKETTVKEVCYDASWNTGVFHPVVNFDTVELESTDVSNANLYNYQNVLDLGIGKGSKIVVAKASMTIPVVLEVLTKVEKPEEVKCPYCGETLVPFGIDLVCPNPGCKTWLYMIQERMIRRYSKTPDEYLGYLYANYSEVLTGMVNDFRDDWYDDILTPSGILAIASIPRVGTSKISKITESMSGKTYSSFKELKDDIYWHLTELQWNYFEVIMPKIEFIVNKLKGE